MQIVALALALRHKATLITLKYDLLLKFIVEKNLKHPLLFLDFVFSFISLLLFYYAILLCVATVLSIMHLALIYRDFILTKEEEK